MKEDEDSSSQKSTAVATASTAFGGSNRSRTNVGCTESLIRYQNQRLRVYNSKHDFPVDIRDLTSTSRSQYPLFYSSSSEDADKRYKNIAKISQAKEVKVYSNPKYVVSDCWKTTSGDLPFELFKEEEEEEEEEREEAQPRKRRLSLDDEGTGRSPDRLSYTQEYHAMTEVQRARILTEGQKARILTAIEDAIKKLANSEYNTTCRREGGRPAENQGRHAGGAAVEKYCCRRFLLPWVIIKVMEMVVCHIIQLTFLSTDTYFQRKYEFLPVFVTYYFTLFIIIFSLTMHIICYSYAGIQHPCYFMCVISSSILTLTTALGMMIMLCSMEYHKTFREILVLVFIGALLCSLIAELCICYHEMKNFWTKMHGSEELYLS